MIRFLIFVCFSATAFAQGPQPPNEETVRMIFNQEYGQQLLFFSPHTLPVELERTHKAMVNRLDPWVKLGLLTKTKTRFLAEKMMYGSMREVSVGGFKYDYNQSNPWVSEQGVFYGRPTMQAVFDVSRPTHIGSDYYSEVYLSWHVVDIPDWVNKVDLRERKHRQLRRAIESKKRPFEKRLYLLYRSGQWQVWKEKGEQSLF